MAQELNIRHFLRQVPKSWLERHFENERVLADFNWSAVSVKNIGPLMDAWLTLDADVRGRAIQDFSDIKLLATPVGKVQIIDEAAYSNKEKEVAAKLAELDDFFDCAFWTFFEQPKFWKGAIRYATADGKSKRYWRKRINIPTMGRHPTNNDGTALATALTDVFRRKEGRGDHCIVEQYRRGATGQREYYFAYIQDHRQVAVEYRNGAMTKRRHAPAFEVIFVHEDDQQTLSVRHDGQKDIVQELQVAFVKSVIGKDVPLESPRDDRVYDLNMLLNPSFEFHPAPELGKVNIEIRRMGLRVLGDNKHSITVDLGDKTPGYILRLCIEAATHEDLWSRSLELVCVLPSSQGLTKRSPSPASLNCVGLTPQI